MDTSKQVSEIEVSALQEGLYADIKETFRAPVVNSIWQTLVANDPELTTYIWGQVKPAFQTRQFAAFTVAFRDRVLSGADPDLPRYTLDEIGINATEFAELQGQLATLDTVAPRLAVLFRLIERRLKDQPVGTEASGSGATAPFPTWLDRDMVRPTVRLPQHRAREAMPEDLAGGFDEIVPSIYRCLAQWPSYLERAPGDIRPIVESSAFETALTEAYDLAETYLDRLPYTPRLDPAGLREIGLTQEEIEDYREFFTTFKANGREVLPLLHLFPATVGAAGEREALTFP